VAARLNAAVNKTLQTEKVRESFAKLGADVGGGTPEQFGVLLRGEIAHWTKVIRDAGIKINS
jgi:tripartite-type tricarboxylate transporter receptor subunit TctC